MAKLLIAMVVIAVSGCAFDTMVKYQGPSLSYNHGTAVDPMGYPMQYAQQYCAQAGMSAKYVRTFYPHVQGRQKYNAVLDDSRDPGYAGQLLSQAGDDLQDAGDSIAAMPTSYYKCVK